MSDYSYGSEAFKYTEDASRQKSVGERYKEMRTAGEDNLLEVIQSGSGSSRPQQNIVLAVSGASDRFSSLFTEAELKRIRERMDRVKTRLGLAGPFFP